MGEPTHPILRRTCQTERVDLREIRWPNDDEPAARLTELAASEVVDALAADPRMMHIQRIGENLRLVWSITGELLPVVILLARVEDAMTWRIREARPMRLNEIQHWRKEIGR